MLDKYEIIKPKTTGKIEETKRGKISKPKHLNKLEDLIKCPF
jgi:hypothetical protein